MKIRSMRGEEIDITAYMARNEHKIALGNAQMNARGDIIGRGGQIVKKREIVAQEYHNSNPKAVVKNIALSKLANEVMLTPKEAVEMATANRPKFEPTVDIQPTSKRKIVDKTD